MWTVYGSIVNAKSFSRTFKIICGIYRVLTEKNVRHWPHFLLHCFVYLIEALNAKENHSDVVAVIYIPRSKEQHSMYK